mmetsp:Transcript_11218/g.14939  ORF Transcript_11218/g.14939 Transcript_11218/m.14939 type:complete len:159 (+) Transcript_11218:152-628(+)
MGGQVVGVCSQPEDIVAQTKKDWQIDFEILSDPENEVAKHFNVAISSRPRYPNGMAQPSVISQRSSGEELYNWRINPSLMNMGGAKDRPKVSDIWRIIQGKLTGKEVRDSQIEFTSDADVLQTMPAMMTYFAGVIGDNIFYFLLVSVAILSLIFYSFR